MTPKEISAELRKLKEEVGPRADVHVHISTWYVSGTIYPDGIDKSARSIHADALDSFDAIIASLRDKWAAYKATHRADTIRKMALAIIDITAEHGRCSDAALRLRFDADEIKFYGADAVAEANAIAANGPFSIQHISDGNGAPVEEDEAA